ncbi:MAG: RnfABCDGE type electron transport complex subunit D, partial [Clostridia bacterium]|nr:RnfABCDGE type electron transport complex subunit D [Clostridia bacterium]
ASAMSNWPVPRQEMLNFGVDAVTGATPLAVMAGSEGKMPSLLNMLLGIRGGCLGETCAVALIIGGIYLVARKVILPAIPLSFIGTVAVIMFIAEKGDFSALAYQLLSGGLLLGAIFMATDYATSPISLKGKIVFVIGCGVITCLIRIFGSYPEGVSFSIIIMNILVPHIEKLTTPKPFGTPKKEKKAKEAQA